MRYKGKNRRRGPDLLIRVKRFVTMTVFGINTVLVILVSIAKPRNETMFDRFAGSSVSGGWKGEVLQYIIMLLLLQFALSIAGLFIENARHRRKRDSYSLMLILSLCVSIIGIVIVLI